MAKRRKKLPSWSTPKILTYGEIDRRIDRHYRKHKNARCEVTLYGSVSACIPAINANHFELKWYGNLRKAGGPDESRRIVFARVYAMSDGDTGYVVSGVGKVRNNNAENLAAIKVWKRYVAAFTPHDPKEQMVEGESEGYRIHNGEAIGGQALWGGAARPIIAGSWWTMPTANRPALTRWSTGGQVPGRPDQMMFRLYPKFMSRSKRFATDLRKRLADGPASVVQLLHQNEGCNFHKIGLQLHVCLPPTKTQDGKRLVVHAAMHDKESRQFHHVDGDYSPRHSQYFAWVQGDPKVDAHFMRWKCGKDALNGIVDWVLGSIHIPGPE